MSDFYTFSNNCAKIATQLDEIFNQVNAFCRKAIRCQVSTNTAPETRDGALLPVPEKSQMHNKNVPKAVVSLIMLPLIVFYTTLAEEPYLAHAAQYPVHLLILTFWFHLVFSKTFKASKNLLLPSSQRLNRFVFILVSFIQLADGSNEFPSASIDIIPTSMHLTLDTGSFNYTCTGCAEKIFFSVDGVNVDHINNKSSFYQHPVVYENELKPCGIRRVLSVVVSRSINTSNITCTVYNTQNNPSGVVSEPPAKILIEDSLREPLDISYYRNYTSGQLEVSWKPPQTRYNTSISKYDISSNVDIFNRVTSNTSVAFPISSPEISCKRITLNVSAYNGLSGKPAQLPNIYVSSLPMPTTDIPIRIRISKYDDMQKIVQLSLLINISNLCYGEFPTEFSYNISDENCSLSYIESSRIRQVNVSETMKEIEHLFSLSYTAISTGKYCVKVSFGNSAAQDFGIISRNYIDLIEQKISQPTHMTNETNPTSDAYSTGFSVNFLSNFWMTLSLLFVSLCLFNIVM